MDFHQREARGEVSATERARYLLALQAEHRRRCAEVGDDPDDEAWDIDDYMDALTSASCTGPETFYGNNPRTQTMRWMVIGADADLATHLMGCNPDLNPTDFFTEAEFEGYQSTEWRLGGPPTVTVPSRSTGEAPIEIPTNGTEVMERVDRNHYHLYRYIHGIVVHGERIEGDSADYVCTEYWDGTGWKHLMELY